MKTNSGTASSSYSVVKNRSKLAELLRDFVKANGGDVPLGDDLDITAYDDSVIIDIEFDCAEFAGVRLTESVCLEIKNEN